MMSASKTKFVVASLAAAVALCWTSAPDVLAQTTGMSKREAAKARVQAERNKLQNATVVTPNVTPTMRIDATPMLLGAPTMLAPAPLGFQDYSKPNYANSPLLTKFIDPLPGLCSATVTTNCIPVAKADTATYSGSDYYEIGVKDYKQPMHSELPAATALRGYYQKNMGGTPNAYLGPIIVAAKDRPVRIKFFNEKLADGKHIIPVDPTVMGAGPFETGVLSGTTTVGMFGENRSAVHLHGGFTPWISDGTPHQWVSPRGELGDYKEGVSLNGGVPDMVVTENLVNADRPDLNGGKVGDGILTLYYPNEQSNRLMFYHDHAYGITRLNVYAGEAAGYIIHDAAEDALIAAGTLPNLPAPYTWGVPLIIQDKSFVHQGTPLTDPTWFDVAPTSAMGDLWFPHVYVPNQDPFNYSGIATSDGMNPMGRWDYGPWIWPPAAVQVPDTLPNPSIVPEAFMDTMVVNGKVYPFFDVQRKAYRFRILNASNDRFLNLQLYYAYDDGVVSGLPASVCDGKQSKTKATCTEVKMVPRNGAIYTYTPPGETVAVTTTVPDDGYRAPVPDPRTGGPRIMMIGNEGGFLPAAVVKNLPPVPVTFDNDPKSMTVGNVKAGTIILGPAERADVVIDFSGVPDGARLILYNDAPAAFPAGDPRYDYYTGNPDLTAMGGAATTVSGKGPNTRTIMQFRVAGKTASPAFNFAALQTAISTNYATAQDPPLVPQPDYPQAGMPTNNQYASLFNTTDFTFKDALGNTVTLPIHQKAIAEEFDVAYGRMSALLGTEAQITNNQGQNTFGFAYIDPSTENLPAGVTQIWKITHNGVDTHAIHWHLVNVQVINRVDWAGVVKAPDPDELGWKETVRMNPLEDIIVAVQAKAPTLPFTITDSVRPKDVTMPIGSTMNFTQPWPYVHDIALQQPSAFPLADPNPSNTVNEMTNFGWEYVWHCHLLGHEENDMMRPLVMTGATTSVIDTVAPTVVAVVSPAPNAAGWNNAAPTVTLTATDNPGGSGVASITYSATGANTCSGSATASPAILTAICTALDGITTITYSATDNAATPNISTPQTLTVLLDRTPPVLTGPTPAVSGTSVTITGSVADAPGSGPLTGTGAGTYSITPLTAKASPGSAGTFSITAGGSFSFSRTRLKSGDYSVTVTVKDIAGNSFSSAAVPFTIL